MTEGFSGVMPLMKNYRCRYRHNEDEIQLTIVDEFDRFHTGEKDHRRFVRVTILLFDITVKVQLLLVVRYCRCMY